MWVWNRLLSWEKWLSIIHRIHCVFSFYFYCFQKLCCLCLYPFIGPATLFNFDSAFLVIQHLMTLKSPTDQGTECINHPAHLIGLWADLSPVTRSLKGLFLLLVGPWYVTFIYYCFYSLYICLAYIWNNSDKYICCLLLNLYTVKFYIETSSVQKVDLGKLEMAALRRYWRHFNLVSYFEERMLVVLLSLVGHFLCLTFWIFRWMPSPTHQKSN